MSIVTSFSSVEPVPSVKVADYLDVLRYLQTSVDDGMGKFTAVAKRHLHHLLPAAHLLPAGDDIVTRWVAHVTTVCPKAEAAMLETPQLYEKWAGRLYKLVTKLALLVTEDDPQVLTLIGPAVCNVVEMTEAYSFSVKQKWSFCGA
jgi:hypothetical protein